MGHAVDGKGDRRGDDVVDLNAGLATEGADEKEQSGVLDGGEQDRRGDVVDAVSERHGESDHHQQQIGGDQVPILLRVVIGEDDRVDDGEERDQERHRVDDGQPAAHRARIALACPIRRTRTAVRARQTLARDASARWRRCYSWERSYHAASFRRKPESREQAPSSSPWIPACAGMTGPTRTGLRAGRG